LQIDFYLLCLYFAWGGEEKPCEYKQYQMFVGVCRGGGSGSQFCSRTINQGLAVCFDWLVTYRCFFLQVVVKNQWEMQAYTSIWICQSSSGRS